jgi:hypothetical protein
LEGTTNMKNKPFSKFAAGFLALAAGLTGLSATSAMAGEGGNMGAYSNVTTCEAYTVKSGDTLGSIAKRAHGTSGAAAAIFELNRDVLSSPNKIVPGMVIDLPCGLITKDLADKPVAIAGWKALPGEFLVPVLVRWGEKAGYDVIVNHNSDWRFGVGYSHDGAFRGAVDEVIAGFSTAAVPPVVVFYTNNVMTIGVH